MIKHKQKSLKQITEQISILLKERDQSIEYSRFMKKGPHGDYSYLDVHIYSLKDVIYKFGELSSIIEKAKYDDFYTDLSTVPKSVLVPLKIDKTYFTKKYYFFLRPLSYYIKETELASLEPTTMSSPDFYRKHFRDAVIFLEDKYKKEISELEEKVTDKYIATNYSTYRQFVNGVAGDGFRMYYKESEAQKAQDFFQQKLRTVKGKLEILEYFAK